MTFTLRIVLVLLFPLSLALMCPTMGYAQQTLVLQAELMPIKSGGEISSDGNAVTISDRGSISQPVILEKGKYRREIKARGMGAQDSWPALQVKIDGVVFGGPVSVDSEDWRVYTVEGSVADLTAGNVAIALVNTGEQNGQSHSRLEIDQVTIDQLAPPDKNTSVPWKLTVVLVAPIDATAHVQIPLKQAIEFIESRTRLVFDVQYVMTYSGHNYTPYRFGKDLDGDGIGDEVAYLMMQWNMPKDVLDSLPVTSSYLFLVTMDGLRPLQAGSALGVDYGIWKGGKPRPYAAVPTDQWWYVNQPYEGFSSRAAQILTHELINTIQGKIEAAPYYCPTLTGESKWATEYEAQRLLKLDDQCYEKLGA